MCFKIKELNKFSIPLVKDLHHINIIKAKVCVCMYVYLLPFDGLTAKAILIKFDIGS